VKKRRRNEAEKNERPSLEVKKKRNDGPEKRGKKKAEGKGGKDNLVVGESSSVTSVVK